MYNFVDNNPCHILTIIDIPTSKKEPTNKHKKEEEVSVMTTYNSWLKCEKGCCNKKYTIFKLFKTDYSQQMTNK